MKKIGFTAMTLMCLAGCTQLSSEDRALLNSTHAMAQEARNSAAQAAQDAALAREQAEAAQQNAAMAAREAQDASETSSRIFTRSTNK